MTRTHLAIAILLSTALLPGCLDRGTGQKLWVAGARQESRVDRAIQEGAWIGMDKARLERVLRAQVFPDHIVDFSYGPPDDGLFGAEYDEALVIHRPLKFDDVWILFRDGKVAAVKPIFIE